MTSTRRTHGVPRRAAGILMLAGAVVLAGCDETPTEPPPPVATQVEVEPATVNLTEPGASAQLTATVRDADGQTMPDAPVTWSSSDSGVATVSDTGEVQAQGEGAATITAQSGEASGSAQVTVDFPAVDPAQIVIDPGEATLSEVGETAQFTATAFDAEGGEIADATFTWATSDEDVATVDATGLVEAVGAGTATLTATIGEVSGTAQVTVDLEADEPAAAEIRFDPSVLFLTEIGGTTQLQWTVLDADGMELEDVSLEWTTSDEAVATVDSAGVVEAMADGTATITATSGEVSGTVAVTVDGEAETPASIEISPDSHTLEEIGATVELTATVLDDEGNEIPGVPVIWATSDVGVATVDTQGAVQAVADGTVTITASIGEASGTAEVTVDTEGVPDGVPAEVAVDPAEVTLTEIGETAELTATVRDAEGMELPDAEVEWASSDEDVATVDENGVVEAVAEGTVTITATSGEASGTAEVTVDTEGEPDPVAAEVVVEPAEVTLSEIGATAELTATVRNAEGMELPDAEVEWTSSDEDVATVDENGVVEAVADGTVTITASSGEVFGTAEVTVDTEGEPGGVAAEVVVEPAEVTLTEIGETEELTAIVTDAEGLELPDALVEWESSDEDIVTVDENGVVEAVAEGTATITATSGEVSGTAEVTVDPS